MRVSFDPDYEDMVAELYCGDHCVCLVSQERGGGEMELRLFPKAEALIDLDTFLAAVAKARRRLVELRPIR